MLPMVCYPYEFTLLSNFTRSFLLPCRFVTPMNLHCSQTDIQHTGFHRAFVTPMNLHCSQTLEPLRILARVFVTPMNLHCSQTLKTPSMIGAKFVTPMNLHCSQTAVLIPYATDSLLPL